ncbi:MULTISPECIES: excalibur calcium-binding domain-containing protein [unclassified Sphingomonas]|uniref:excalibur calcium-binding domain-containing protein n=1 Tax=unclassified Sphingomonas TaxID=196159 RepID=UPI0009E6EBF5|nr:MULTISPECIES: excalibur calcium-binding domain-containing protein [unclassified Sphingomonas]
MSFKKPFRAVPIKLGERYRREQRRNDRTAAVRFLGIAAALGALIGIGTVAIDQDGRAAITSALKPVAVQAGLARARQPQPGDRWGGCNDARAAGTAPIYSGEPSYREDMDGDGDGVACEPYR